MKLGKTGLRLLFIVCFIAVTMSFLAENIVVKTFTNEILAKRVSGYFLDQVIHDVDMDILEKMDDQIRNSKYTEKIAAKFIQNITENVLYSKGAELDLSEEVEGLVRENVPEGIADETAAGIKKYVAEKITDTEARLEGTFFYSFGDGYYLQILKLYHLLTSLYVRIILLLLWVADLVGLIILEKQEALKTIQIGSFVTAVFTAMVFFLIKGLSAYIEQRFSGGWIRDVYLNRMIAFLVLELFLGLGFLGIRKTIAYRKKSDYENTVCK